MTEDQNTTPPPAGDVAQIVAECRDLALERGERAAEQFMIAGLLRDQDRDPSGFLAAGEQAARAQRVLTEAAAALERLSNTMVGSAYQTMCDRVMRLERERDEANARHDTLYVAHLRLDEHYIERLEAERAARERAEAALRDASDYIYAVAYTLDRWAAESRVGGWSTHQVRANIEAANNCRREAAKAHAALQPQPQPQGGG